MIGHAKIVARDFDRAYAAPWISSRGSCHQLSDNAFQHSSEERHRLQRRMFAEDSSTQQNLRSLIARSVSASVYGMIAVYLNFTFGWTVLMILLGFSVSRLRNEDSGAH